MASLQNTTIDDETFKLPAGTTAQRPQNPQVGMIRFNTTLNQTEFYNGTAWVAIDN